MSPSDEERSYEKLNDCSKAGTNVVAHGKARIERNNCLIQNQKCILSIVLPLIEFLCIRSELLSLNRETSPTCQASVSDGDVSEDLLRQQSHAAVAEEVLLEVIG